MAALPAPHTETRITIPERIEIPPEARAPIRRYYLGHSGGVDASWLRLGPVVSADAPRGISNAMR